MSSAGSFFSYVNDAWSHEPECLTQFGGLCHTPHSYDICGLIIIFRIIAGNDSLQWNCTNKGDIYTHTFCTNEGGVHIHTFRTHEEGTKVTCITGNILAELYWHNTHIYWPSEVLTVSALYTEPLSKSLNGMECLHTPSHRDNRIIRCVAFLLPNSRCHSTLSCHMLSRNIFTPPTPPLLLHEHQNYFILLSPLCHAQTCAVHVDVQLSSGVP